MSQSTDPYAEQEVSDIWKFRDGPLTYPCYAFNNSYYTEARCFKEGEATNQQMNHFNNAHFFYEREGMVLEDWHQSFKFDHDIINTKWPRSILISNQEQNGFDETDVMFVNGLEMDFRLQDGSPAIDKGRVMNFPRLDWEQHFKGTSTDIGAYEKDVLIDGPPFKYIPPLDNPTLANYQEKPRIVKHRVADNLVTLYFSTTLSTQEIEVDDIKLFADGNEAPINNITFPNSDREMLIELNNPVSTEGLRLQFVSYPQGSNGERATLWGSTIKSFQGQSQPPGSGEEPRTYYQPGRSSN